MIVGQGPIALAVGAGGGCLDIFPLVHLFSFPSPTFWEMPGYRLKYCLKGPLNTKQPTNHISIFPGCMVWIEKSVTRVTDWHHEAYRVMPNSNPE